jgi:hypothetical protein
MLWLWFELMISPFERAKTVHALDRVDHCWSALPNIGEVVNNELRSAWKEAGAAEIKVISRLLPGRIEESHKNRESRQLLSPPIFDSGASWMHVPIATVWIKLLDGNLRLHKIVSSHGKWESANILWCDAVKTCGSILAFRKILQRCSL